MRIRQQPTEAEYAILQVLWKLQSGTVREVYTVLSEQRDIGYTSVLKTLQIMTEKGFVLRNETERAHVYTPVSSEEMAQGSIVSDLLQRVFGGSAQHLVLRALQVHPATKAELSEIRRLLDTLESEE